MIVERWQASAQAAADYKAATEGQSSLLQRDSLKRLAASTMADFEIYESAVRSREDLGAFFEHDGDTGYFYLVEDPHSENQNEDETNIIAHIWILNEKPDFGQDDVAVEWDRTERRVGLFIKGRLWAVFDQFGARYGGRYRPEEEPAIPDDIVEGFKPLTS